MAMPLSAMVTSARTGFGRGTSGVKQRRPPVSKVDRFGQPILDPNDPRAQGGVEELPADPGMPQDERSTRSADPMMGDRLSDMVMRRPSSRADRSLSGLPPAAGQTDGTGGVTEDDVVRRGRERGTQGPMDQDRAGRPMPTDGAAPSTTPMAGGAMARYGTGNIPGAESITGGPYGSRASSRASRLAADPNDRGAQTIKNITLEIASRYPPKPSSIPLILADPDFQERFPEATQVGFDKIDFGDGYPVDIGVNFDEGADSGQEWSFQTSNPADAVGGEDGAFGIPETPPWVDPDAPPTSDTLPVPGDQPRVSGDAYRRLARRRRRGGGGLSDMVTQPQQEMP